MGYHGSRLLGIRLHRVNRADQIPIHDLGHAAVNKVVVERLDDADFAVKAILVHMLFRVPDRLSAIPRVWPPSRAGRRRRRFIFGAGMSCGKSTTNRTAIFGGPNRTSQSTPRWRWRPPRPSEKRNLPPPSSRRPCQGSTGNIWRISCNRACWNFWMASAFIPTGLLTVRRKPPHGLPKAARVVRLFPKKMCVFHAPKVHAGV